MNKLDKNNGKEEVKWLFLDLNSFFASCEQQECPELRGRPVAIVQMMTDSTCAIAASYEAKAFGIKTGTAIWEAKKACPDLILVKARHKLYLRYHHKIIAAVNTCLPVTKICSIDEMTCRLIGDETIIDVARSLAEKIKQTIRQEVGVCMTCSVGLAPSQFLGKVASDMQKPDGLVVITQKDLPCILYPLALTDISGIGTRMASRLHQAGITTVVDLMAASRASLRHIWGGIYGVLYYELLHGADLQFPTSKEKKSIGHQHILEPGLRTLKGAKEFAEHLLSKAAERLRHQGYYCSQLGFSLTSVDRSQRFWNETRFQETQDTGFLLLRLAKVVHNAPPMKPLKVSIVLFGLVPIGRHQPDLFSEQLPKSLSPAIDKINQRFGRGAIGFGKHSDQIKNFTGHTAFQRVPEEFEF